MTKCGVRRVKKKRKRTETESADIFLLFLVLDDVQQRREKLGLMA